ncbi:TPA: hypothetical protein ACX6S4_003019 [Photobacterium damselae]
MNINKKILVSLIGFLLTGCGDNLIDQVKESQSEYDATFTNLQLFSNKNFCTSTSWSEVKDQNGRNIVQVNCKLRSTLPIYKQIVDSAVKSRISIYGRGINNLLAENKNTEENIKFVSELKTIQQISALNPLDVPKCGEASYGMMMLSMDANPDINDKNRKPDNNDVQKTVKLCINELNKIISTNNNRINNAKIKLKKFETRINSYADNIIMNLPDENNLIVQWSITAKDKKVILGGMSLYQKSKNGKTTSYSVYANEVFQQAINPSNDPLKSISSFTDNNEFANKILLMRKFNNFE